MGKQPRQVLATRADRLRFEAKAHAVQLKWQSIAVKLKRKHHTSAARIQCIVRGVNVRRATCQHKRRRTE